MIDFLGGETCPSIVQRSMNGRSLPSLLSPSPINAIFPLTKSLRHLHIHYTSYSQDCLSLTADFPLASTLLQIKYLVVLRHTKKLTQTPYTPSLVLKSTVADSYDNHYLPYLVSLNEQAIKRIASELVSEKNGKEKKWKWKMDLQKRCSYQLKLTTINQIQRINKGSTDQTKNSQDLQKLAQSLSFQSVTLQFEVFV